MKRFILLTFLWALCGAGLAQETLVPLRSNPSLIYPDLRMAAPGTQGPVQNPAQRTQAASLFIPFIEDFFYAPKQSIPDPAKWSDSSAFVNAGYPISPPSIGVATFDGLNKHGYPYDPLILNNNVSRPADRLTSQPINLLVTAASQTLQPSDSVALSFYYQSTGHGETPELSDSLALDFFAPLQNKWYNAIWYKKRSGTSNLSKGDTTFTRAFIWIDSAKFLQDGFRFRFRNSATTTGNFDHWHVDYIYLDKNRSMKADTVFNDLTFLYVPNPMLRDYSAMPWEQYNAGEMAPKTIVKIKNNSPANLNVTYGYRIDSAATQLSTYNGFASNLYAHQQATYAPHANPVVNYTFNPLGDSADFRITHYMFQSNTPTDFVPRNDSVVFYQRFRNYYALDDGSAEAGYYVSVPQSKMAIKVNVNVPDSFLALRVYFDPVGQINQAMGSAGFSICVWGNSAGGPGNLVFRDNSVFQPKYFDVDPAYSFAEFKLKSPTVLSPGTYYIGIQQRSDVMTIGFDRNYDHRTNTYYTLGNNDTWYQSDIKGSIMIRPVFGKTLPPPVGMDEASAEPKEKIRVYPNPASEQVTIRHNGSEPLSYALSNAMGQLLDAGTFSGTTGQIHTAQLPAGIYFLVLKNNTRVLQQQKLIIQH